MLAERIKKWPEKWLKEGEAIGEAKGKAELLIDLLKKRFQPLSKAQQDVVYPLKSEVIISVIEYLFQASSLDEIF
ncbi:MAG TPA: hypothetical protein ENJ28_01860, partial [Gammaproteobacteria bacterium]|nr:hypothetical protein [Gammaproteobacteria bacterium]